MLAEKQDLPFCSADAVREAYYRKVGYDEAYAAQIATSEQGIQGVLRYSKPFEARMVEMILADHNEYFVRHPANYQLAKLVIYTKDKTPEDICEELVQRLV